MLLPLALLPDWPTPRSDGVPPSDIAVFVGQEPRGPDVCPPGRNKPGVLRPALLKKNAETKHQANRLTDLVIASDRRERGNLLPGRRGPDLWSGFLSMPIDFFMIEFDGIDQERRVAFLTRAI